MIHQQKMLRAAVLGSAAVLMIAAPAFAQRGGQQRDVPPPRANAQFLGAFREATAEASKCTVRVLCDDKDAALGTVIGPDGWILTKSSLLSGNISCMLKDGRTLQAKIVGIHEPFDLAMLKVDATDLPAVKLTESKAAPVGSWLVSVGLGENPVAVGVMSVATRTPPPVPNRGGGGPQRSNGPGRAFPVLSATTVGLLASPAGHGPLLAASALGASRGPNTDYLGVSVTPEGGAAKVSRVAPRSAASRAGLRVDDKILSIQGTAVTDQGSLLALLGTMKPGDSVTIKLVREGKEMELKATLAQGGPPARPDQNLMGSVLSERRTGFPTYFQSDTVIKPNDCGGPICDLEGHVLGINIARAGRVESYSIPTEALTPVLADLMSGKMSPKALAAAALEKKVTEAKAALKKAEEDKTAAEKKLQETQDALKKQEADKAGAEKKWQEAKDALDKAEKELKDKK
jgi:serine protease Do